RPSTSPTQCSSDHAIDRLRPIGERHVLEAIAAGIHAVPAYPLHPPVVIFSLMRAVFADRHTAYAFRLGISNASAMISKSIQKPLSRYACAIFSVISIIVQSSTAAASKPACSKSKRCTLVIGKYPLFGLINDIVLSAIQ